MAQHLDRLDVDNRRAWDLTHLVCSRFLSERRGTGPVLALLLADCPAEEREDVLRRMNVIYDVLVPVPRRQTD